MERLDLIRQVFGPAVIHFSPDHFGQSFPFGVLYKFRPDLVTLLVVPLDEPKYSRTAVEEAVSMCLCTNVNGIHRVVAFVELSSLTPVNIETRALLPADCPPMTTILLMWVLSSGSRYLQQESENGTGRRPR